MPFFNFHPIPNPTLCAGPSGCSAARRQLRGRARGVVGALHCCEAGAGRVGAAGRAAAQRRPGRRRLGCRRRRRLGRPVRGRLAPPRGARRRRRGGYGAAGGAMGCCSCLPSAPQLCCSGDGHASLSSGSATAGRPRHACSCCPAGRGRGLGVAQFLQATPRQREWRALQARPAGCLPATPRVTTLLKHGWLA